MPDRRNDSHRVNANSEDSLTVFVAWYVVRTQIETDERLQTFENPIRHRPKFVPFSDLADATSAENNRFAGLFRGSGANLKSWLCGVNGQR
jgi:hypothetical protein